MTPTQRDQHSRFVFLDGVRGVAAIAVMLFHYSKHIGLNWLPGAWVAVDLFFILSGFVIMHSYGRKIASGFSFGQFARARLIRLLPLYFLGLALGLAAALLQWRAVASSAASGQDILTAALLGTVVLPDLHTMDWTIGKEILHGPIFPLNTAAWSLFFEFAVNILFFAYMRRVERRYDFKYTAVLYAVAVGCMFLARQLNPGPAVHGFLWGFPRVISEFLLGMYLYEIRAKFERLPRALAIGLVVLTLVLYFVNVPRLMQLNQLLFAPIAVVAGATVSRARLDALCRHLGELSYPLYIVHFPLLAIAFQVPEFQQLSALVQILAIALPALVVAYVLALCDAYWRGRIKSATRSAVTA